MTVVLVSVVVLAACGGTDTPGDAPAATATLKITALAGPVCPVETDPPSPECAPRTVDGASIVVTDSGGTEVARGITGPDGVVVIAVEPGELTIVAQPVEGLLGTAAELTVTAAAGQTVPVELGYDTGIR